MWISLYRSSEVREPLETPLAMALIGPRRFGYQIRVARYYQPRGEKVVRVRVDQTEICGWACWVVGGVRLVHYAGRMQRSIRSEQRGSLAVQRSLVIFDRFDFLDSLLLVQIARVLTPHARRRENPYPSRHHTSNSHRWSRETEHPRQSHRLRIGGMVLVENWAKCS